MTTGCAADCGQDAGLLQPGILLVQPVCPQVPYAGTSEASLCRSRFLAGWPSCCALASPHPDSKCEISAQPLWDDKLRSAPLAIKRLDPAPADHHSRLPSSFPVTDRERHDLQTAAEAWEPLLCAAFRVLTFFSSLRTTSEPFDS
jgi:hypothetical protein